VTLVATPTVGVGISVVDSAWRQMNKELKLLIISFVFLIGTIVYYFVEYGGG